MDAVTLANPAPPAPEGPPAEMPSVFLYYPSDFNISTVPVWANACMHAWLWGWVLNTPAGVFMRVAIGGACAPL